MVDSRTEVPSGISIASFIPKSLVEDVLEDFRTADPDFKFEQREPEVFAAIQYLLPTAVMLVVAGKYLDGFIGKLGEDHYEKLKSGLKTLWLRFGRSDSQWRAVVVGTGGKIIEGERSSSLSFVARALDGSVFKLILAETLDQQTFDSCTSAFFQYVHAYSSATTPMPAAEPNWKRVTLVTWSEEHGSLEEIDLSETVLARQLITKPLRKPKS